MTHSSASNFPYIEPPASFTLNPGGRIAHGPQSSDVYSIWTANRDVEVMVHEETAGGPSLPAVRDLRDDLDAAVVALGILGVTA